MGGTHCFSSRSPYHQSCVFWFCFRLPGSLSSFPLFPARVVFSEWVAKKMKSMEFTSGFYRILRMNRWCVGCVCKKMGQSKSPRFLGGRSNWVAKGDVESSQKNSGFNTLSLGYPFGTAHELTGAQKQWLQLSTSCWATGKPHLYKSLSHSITKPHYTVTLGPKR